MTPSRRFLQLVLLSLILLGSTSLTSGFQETYLEVENKSEVFQTNKTLYEADQEIPKFADVQHTIRVTDSQLKSTLRIYLKTDLPFPLELRPSSTKISHWKVSKNGEPVLEKKIVDDSTAEHLNGTKGDVIKTESHFPKTSYCDLKIPLSEYKIDKPPVHPYPLQSCNIRIVGPTLANHTFRSKIHLPDHRVPVKKNTVLKAYNQRVIDNSLYNRTSNITEGYCHIQEKKLNADLRQTSSNNNKTLLLSLEEVNNDVIFARSEYNCKNFNKAASSTGPILALEYTPDKLSKGSFYLFLLFFLTLGIHLGNPNILDNLIPKKITKRANESIIAIFSSLVIYYLHFNNPEQITVVFFTPIFLPLGYLLTRLSSSLRRSIRTRWSKTQRHNFKRKVKNRIFNKRLGAILITTLFLISTFSFWMHHSKKEKVEYSSRNMTFEGAPEWFVDVNKSENQSYSTSLVNNDTQERISFRYEDSEINASNTTKYLDYPLEYFVEEKEESTSNFSQENLTSFYYSFAPPTQRIRITDNGITKNFFVFHRHIEIGNNSDFTDIRSVIFATVHREKELKFIYTKTQENPINQTQRDRAFELFRELELKLLVNKTIRKPIIGDSTPITDHNR